MIYSKKLKLVFLKGRKVAGTSVEILLSSLCGPDDIITPITPIDEKARLEFGGRQPQNYGAEPIAVVEYIRQLCELPAEKAHQLNSPKGTYYNHMRFRNVLKQTGNLPKDFRAFCVERSPYLKIISAANMRHSFNNYIITGQRMAATNEEISKSIQTFIDKEKLHKMSNLPIYLNSAKQFNLEFINFDNLNEDLKKLLRERGVENPPDLPHAKKGRNVNIENLRSILTSTQIKAINEVFRAEFETFRFEMLKP